jgi:hypothetical protein
MIDANSALHWMLTDSTHMLNVFPELHDELAAARSVIPASACRSCATARLGNRIIMLAARAYHARPRALPDSITTMLGSAFRRELDRVGNNRRKVA